MFLHVVAISEMLVHFLQFSLYLGLHVAICGCQFVVLVLHRTLLLTFHPLQFNLLVDDFRGHLTFADADV